VIIFYSSDDCWVALGCPVDVSLAGSPAASEDSGLNHFVIRLIDLLESLCTPRSEVAFVVSTALRGAYVDS
jgi:hypothetical protein